MKIILLITTLFVFSLSNFIGKVDKSNEEFITEKIQTKKSLKGIYKRTKRGLYSSFEFKGKNTVTVKSLGMKFTYSYTIDGKYVKIETNKSNLLLIIKNDKTLIGDGFSKGTYIKN